MHPLRFWIVAAFLPACLLGQGTTPPYYFSTLAGRASTQGTADGDGSTARFNRPWGIALDSSGNVWVTDGVNHTVRKISRSGAAVAVTTVAGQAGVPGNLNGTGSGALLGGTGGSTGSPTGPFGIALLPSGSAIVADSAYHLLRQVTPSREVTTFIGGGTVGGLSGTADASPNGALFNFPVAVAADANGDLYVADTYNHTIRLIAGGVVSTIAGLPGSNGSEDGIGSAARFLHPTAIAIGPSGHVFVADSANTIRRISRIADAGNSWQVTTVAGSPLTYGTTDGVGAAARFGAMPTSSPTGGVSISFPSFTPPVGVPPVVLSVSYRIGDISGLAVDAADNVFIADSGNNAIRRLSASGVVTTLGGSPAVGGSTDGVGAVARFFRPCGLALDSTGTLYIADSINHTIRVGVPAVAPALLAQSSGGDVGRGSTVTLSLTATGSPAPAIQWSRNGVQLTGATAATLVLTNVQSTNAGTYTASVSNALGSLSIVPIVLTVSAVPAITVQPAALSVQGTQTINLSVTATGLPAPTYQWLRNGGPVAGATAASLVIANSLEEHAGDYRVVVTNTFGSAISDVAKVIVNTGRVTNISIRAALTGANPLITGFVVAGGTKQVLVRAIGPALRQFGVETAMVDPQLSLVAGNVVVAGNDNWSAGSAADLVATVAARVGGFPLAANSLDAATVVTVANDATSVLASSRTGAGGVVLVELYDAAGVTPARLVNVSARALVGLGENALFAGFAVGGNSPRRLLIRAIGPTLGAFGIADTLTDPLLEVFAAGATIARARNDNWGGDAALSAAFSSLGAFPLPATTSRDAALIATFEPGAYSARISGVGGTTGEALLEIYELP